MIFAYALGFVGGVPLKTWHWILLGVGLATLSLEEIIIPVLWFLLLSKREGLKDANRAVFNLAQVAILVLTLLSFAVFYEAIKTGLIFSPNMQVVGNGSFGQTLRWYVDMAEGALPEPWVISVPIYVWHGVMIAWSLWLASALIGWLKWGFAAFGAGGYWKSANNQ